jgi:hypothetical protein
VPPRYAFWTILIDDRPTAFRARDQAELLPTLHQLRRTNPNARLKWFARGKLWDSPEQALWAAAHAPKPSDRRGRDWRPGGQHKDPRARHSSKSARHPGRAGPSARARPSALARPSTPSAPEGAPRGKSRPPHRRPRRSWPKKPKSSE